MVKVISNIDIKVSYERERRRMKKKVEAMINKDIENIFEKFHKLKEKLEGNTDNLYLINSNILKFKKFQKGVIALWGEHLRRSP